MSCATNPAINEKKAPYTAASTANPIEGLACGACPENLKSASALITNIAYDTIIAVTFLIILRGLNSSTDRLYNIIN